MHIPCRVRHAMFLALIAALVVGCGGTPRRQLRLGAQEPPAVIATAAADRPLKVAAAPLISPQATLATYSDLFDYVGSQFGRPVEILQRRTYAEINDLIRTGDVDFALVCSFAYVQGNDEFGMELLAMPSVGGKAEYYSYVIVRSDSPFERLEDLRGRAFAFTDPLSTSGRLAPEGLLRDTGATPETFFSRLIFTFSHDNSIKAVVDRVVDGAAVDSLVYGFLIDRDPKLAASLRVIARAGPFGSPPLVTGPRMDPAQRRRLQEILVNMHRDPQGAKVLAAMGTDRFVLPDDRAYDPVRRLYDKVRPRP